MEHQNSGPAMKTSKLWEALTSNKTLLRFPAAFVPVFPAFCTQTHAAYLSDRYWRRRLCVNLSRVCRVCLLPYPILYAFKGRLYNSNLLDLLKPSNLWHVILFCRENSLPLKTRHKHSMDGIYISQNQVDMVKKRFLQRKGKWVTVTSNIEDGKVWLASSNLNLNINEL